MLFPGAIGFLLALQPWAPWLGQQASREVSSLVLLGVQCWQPPEMTQRKAKEEGA